MLGKKPKEKKENLDQNTKNLSQRKSDQKSLKDPFEQDRIPKVKSQGNLNIYKKSNKLDSGKPIKLDTANPRDSKNKIKDFEKSGNISPRSLGRASQDLKNDSAEIAKSENDSVRNASQKISLKNQSLKLKEIKEDELVSKDKKNSKENIDAKKTKSQLDQKLSKKQTKKEKEKDYGSYFLLNLPLQLEELDLKIESKLRIQDSLQSKDLKLLEKASSHYINIQNSNFQDLLQQLKTRKKEQKEDLNGGKIKSLNEELENLVKDKRAIIDQISKFQEKTKTSKSEFSKNKEKLEQELNQEISKQESIKNEMKLKTLEMNLLKDSIMQFSSQIDLIKTLNAQFNSNIDKTNNSIEEANKKYFEVVSKSESNSTIKAKILEAQSDILKNEKKILKYYRRLKEIKKFMDNRKEELKVVLELNLKIEAAMSMMPEFHKEQSAQALENILRTLAEPKSKLERAAVKNKSLEKSMKIKNVELLNQVKLKEIEKKSKQKIGPQREYLLNDVSGLINTNEEIFNEKKEYFQKQIKFFKSQIDDLAKKQKGITDEVEKKQENLAKIKTKYVEATEKLEEIQKSKQSENSINELRKKIEDLNKSLYKSEEISMNSTRTDKDKHIMGILLQLDLLRQETQNKDLEVVGKIREKNKAEEKLEALKMQLQKLSSKTKTADAEILGQINLEIESKDRQIEVLKEMLRGSNSEMKLKDVYLLNYKSKLDEKSTKNNK